MAVLPLLNIALPVLALNIVILSTPSKDGLGVAAPPPIVIEVTKTGSEPAAHPLSCDIPPECGCCGDFATSPIEGVIAMNDLVVFSWHLGETSSSPNWDPCFDIGGSPGFIDASDLAELAYLLCSTCPIASKP